MSEFEDMPEAEDEEVVEESVFEMVMPDPDPIEEDALAVFNKEWNAKLEAKRATEFDAEKGVRAAADQAKKDWEQQRDIRLKAKKSNRSEEQVLQEALESEVDSFKTWERVTKLIDAGEGETKGSDVTRMRKLFIQLKNEPLETTRPE
ncbi:hypothetical protein B484DRAFT_167285 [Ochromonadaceae sp. CCMP2298]|nr:hypothetical protein B484DRAFT_167285 [Ochromonadaceae sp. CCMP2298]